MSDDTSNKSNNTTGNLGFIALVSIVLSSMIGGGIDSLPQNAAQSSAAGPILVAWLIAGFGVYFIANSFRILSDIRPDLKAGIYMYAHEGFGSFIGFIVAWGYWIMTMFGNIAYIIILMDGIDYFFPGKFTGGNNLNSIICGSVLIWGFYHLVLKGTQVTGKINIIGTAMRMIPLFLFILILAFVLNYTQFTTDFWGNNALPASDDLGSLSKQIMAPMIVALWCFVGVEGAVVLSGRAKRKSDVGKATIIGFILALVMYILISVLPFGVADQQTLAKVPDPSTAGVLKMVMGETGVILMNIGLIVSVLVSWLSWTMLCAEIPMVAAENGTFPKIFARKNQNAAADVSLLVSSIIMQIILILIYFAHNAWNTMYSITTVMVLPAYFSTTLFLFKLCKNNEYSKYAKDGKKAALFSGIIGSLFCLFMLYAGGLNYIAMMPLILTLGLPLFIWSGKEQAALGDPEPMFTKKEKLYLSILLLLDVLAIYSVYSGIVKL
ncbi:MAG: basic amino acid/polyamine antiporter [Alphaproteobacteria bacterium]